MIRQLKYRNILSIDALDIQRDIVTCIVGESGSGKTTLLKMLNHLISPDSGTIMIDGRPVTDWDPIELRRKVVMMAQTPVVFKGTIRDNLLVGLRFSEKTEADDERLHEMLDRVGLNKPLDADSSSLSGGEKQRLSLGRILLLDPPVLLLDEPSSALDEETTAFVMDRLTEHVRTRGKTLVVVTHSKAVVRSIADEIVEVADGRAAVITGGAIR